MADSGAAEKLKIFISYSRRDSAAFVDELVMGLQDRGFAPMLDRHDIKPGEPWETRLSGLIEQSDTVVFVVSPQAVKSELCEWEIDKALALSKRLLPVIHKSVPDTEIPPKLSKLQFIPFHTAPGIMRPLRELTEALRVDLEWIREHTRVAELATRWDRRGRPESFLLRADDLGAAKAWIATRKTAAPEITGEQRAFVKASEEAEATRLRKERVQHRRIAWLLGIVAVLLIAWFNQSYLKDQWNRYWKERPYRVANVDDYVLTPAKERALKPGDTFQECTKDCPMMVVIPAGEFMMGSPVNEKDHSISEGPQHSVTIARPFAVSMFDVTFADWDACVSVGGCPQEGRAHDAGWGRGTRPVIHVSWDDAQPYVDWFSRMTGKAYRLLTEAEWEYAARAGTTTAYYWGDEIGKNNANCHRCGSQWDNLKTSPVGSFKPNLFGLYDMAGNVWQWVHDCDHADYKGAPTDGLAWTTGDCGRRIVRGGSWGYFPVDPRSAYRYGDNADDRNYTTGFRVARTLTP